MAKAGGKKQRSLEIIIFHASIDNFLGQRTRVSVSLTNLRQSA